MGRPGVTEEQVFEVAEALLREGLSVTVPAVQKRTGGSNTTINNHLKKWRELNKDREMPHIPDTPERVTQASRQIWAAAWKAAQEEIEAERQALKAARKETEQEREKLLQDMESLEQAVDALTQEKAALQSSVEEEKKQRLASEKITTELRIENARLDEKTTNLEQQVSDFRQQIEKLQEQLTDLARGGKAAKP